MSNENIVKSDYNIKEVSQEAIDNFNIDPYLVQFLLHEPFFSSILRRISKAKTDQIPTAGVSVNDGSFTLYWNPEFLAGLPKKHIVGLLKHECYHLIFNHCTTRRQEPHMLWNIATDLAINSLIDFALLPEGGLVPGHRPKMGENNSASSEAQQKFATRLADMIADFPPRRASEYYMKALMEDPELQESYEQMEAESTVYEVGFDDHGDWGKGLSDEEKQRMEGKLKDMVSKAVKEADSKNSWGTVSQEVREQLRKLYNDSVNWKKVLLNFVGRRQRANKSNTHRRINRKYPYIHPGKQKSYTSNLAVYIDQSGSVNNDVLNMFFGTLEKLAKSVTFTIYTFDTSVDEKSETVWKKGKRNVKPFRTRSGGTCFECVEQHYRKNDGRFDGYIVLTDGAAAKPSSTTGQRCWVLEPGTRLAFQPDKKDTIVSMKV